MLKSPKTKTEDNNFNRKNYLRLVIIRYIHIYHIKKPGNKSHYVNIWRQSYGFITGQSNCILVLWTR